MSDRGLNEVLAELRLLREQLAALRQELRSNKRKTSKRAKTIAQRTVRIADRRPTELELAAARRALRR